MKKMIRLITVAATVALFAFPVATSAAPSLVQDQCTQENKDAWYKTFRETFKTDQQPKAYEAAKKYLTACTEETEITAYLKKWVGIYEKETRKTKVTQLLNEKKYAEAFDLGKQIVNDEPENLKVLVELGYGGYLASTNKNNNFNTDGVNYARKAIQMIEAGKAPESWNPFPNRDEALAFLNYYVGLTTLTQDPSGALSSLLKAARFESSLKKSPYVYDKIAQAYELGSYAKQSEDYTAKYKDKPETPDSKLALENINQVVDRMIDAYARAVALAGADPKFQVEKKQWNDALTQYYKFRKGSDAGLNEMVAGILAKPLPPEPTPLTSLPVAAPASTPTSGTGTTGNGTNGATATTGTSTNTTSTQTTTTKPATTPAATPTKTTGTKPAGPNRPRKSNHRR